jgi:hypothetical protein
VGAWPYIRPTIINDTHSAFEAWAAANNHALPAYNPADVVIQSRCAWDTILLHGEYGPVAWSFYNAIPQDVKQIYLVTNQGQSPEVCHTLHHALQRYGMLCSDRRHSDQHLIYADTFHLWGNHPS